MSAPELPSEHTLVVQPEEQLPMGKSLILGLQHVLAMDVYVVPFIIATIVSLSVTDSAVLIQATFFAAGLATIIQSQWWMKLPIAQGPSYVPIGAVAGIALSAGGGLGGMSAVYGALIPGAVIIIVLGFTPIFRKIINHLVPPIVGGTIILVVGIALMPVGLKANIFSVYPGGSSLHQNVALAATSASLLILFVTLGLKLGQRGIWLRLCSVLLALIGGCLLASHWGLFNTDAIAAASWFSLPHLAFVSFTPTFSGSAIVTMLIIYAVLLAETTGTWFAVSAVIDRPLQDKQIDRGVVGEGLGCLVSALVGSTPVTGYSTNAGIIAITGIASRFAFLSAGLWMMVFVLSGKLAVAIASIPSPVIGGVFIVVCAIIALSGFRVIRHIELNERNMFVIGVPIITALFIDLAPPELLQSLPQTLQYLLSSSIAAGAIVAIVLHQILPKTLKQVY
ncbi:MAG: purine/pyrimidine permease [Neisseriaceae bacterium]|nr:purine/pyrimidine permease [Neisseriaceae bacterium]